MSINKFNPEGYYDPTAYEALTSVQTAEKELKKMNYKPLVFICSPYAGDIEYNVTKAREYSRFAVSQNCIPIAPHLLFPQFMDDTNEQQRWSSLVMGMVIMSKCQELWCFGDKVTKGMAVELERAKKRKIPIRYFNASCEEVQKL